MHAETELNQRAHRVSAHRALTLNPSVPKIAERSALAGLRWGYPDATDANAMSYRSGHRWHQNAAVSLLNDFDFLVQALFADQANKALETHKGVRAGTLGVAEPTKFERLTEIWHRLLPHRRLEITGDDIRVRNPQNDSAYPASEMSDGERAIFYLIGQALLAAEITTPGRGGRYSSLTNQNSTCTGPFSRDSGTSSKLFATTLPLCSSLMTLSSPFRG